MTQSRIEVLLTGCARVRALAATWVVALSLLLPAAPGGAATPASTLADICPGTPDPCVVSGQFSVAPGSVFDAGGRAVSLLDGAQLIGNGVASFSVINAASIDLDPGSLVRTTPQRSPRYIHCPLNEGYTYASEEPLAQFNGEDPNGTWTLQVTNQGVGATGAGLNSWGLEVCTESGCSTVASTDVPLPILFHFPFVPDESDLSVTATGSITRVSVLNVAGDFRDYADFLFDLVSPQGTVVRLLSEPCHGVVYTLPPTPGFSFNVADPSALADDVNLQSTGLCTLGGEIGADDPTGGNGGAVNVDCQAITLEATAKLHAHGGRGGWLTFEASGLCSANGAKLQANGGLGSTSPGQRRGGDTLFACDEVQLKDRTRIDTNAPPQSPSYDRGGTIRLECGATGCNIAPGAKLTTKGSFTGPGGSVIVNSTGPCRIGGKINATSKPFVVFEEEGGGLAFGEGGNGTVQASCASIVVPGKTKITVSKSPFGYAGGIALAAAGTIQIDAKAYLRADGASPFGPSNAFSLTAGDRCTIDGKLSARSDQRQGPDSSFVCEGFTVGRTGQVAMSASGSNAGTINIDTTGVTSGEPAGDCSIAGKVRTTSSSTEMFGGNAGTVRLDCGTTTTIERTGTVDVSCPGFEGEAGFIHVVSGGDATIDGRLSGKGSFRGAGIDVDACDVNLTSHGQVNVGSFGAVTLTAHDMLTMRGAVSAAPDGSVAMNYLNGISLAGAVAPAPVVTQNPLLTPCP